MLNKNDFSQLFKKHLVKDVYEEEIDIVLTGQYGRALELLRDAEATGLFPALVGPPGVGKTMLCRYFASLRAQENKNKSFYWITFDESLKPSHLIGNLGN